MRVVAFAFLTPFFFLKGGMNVSTQARSGRTSGSSLCCSSGRWCRNWSACTRSLAGSPRRMRPSPRCSCPPGFTFGTITSLYGLNAGIIDRTQFSLLVAVVVLSAIVPTVIAQRFYQPDAADEVRDIAEMAEAY